MTSCINCSTDNQAGTKFCTKCGCDMASTACTSCGAPVSPKSKFCNTCGTPTALPVTAPLIQPVIEPIPEPVITPAIEPLIAPHPDSMPALVVEAVATPIIERVARPAKTIAATEAGAASPPDQETSTTQTSVQAPLPMPVPSDQKQLKMIVVGIAAVAVIAGGLFWWQSTRQAVVPSDGTGLLPPITDSANSAEKETPVAATETPTTAAEPAPPVAAAPALEAAPAPAERPAVAETLQPAPHIAIKDKPATVKPAAKAPEANDKLAATTTSLLTKAEGHLNAGQYDKAIATAESVLTLDANNRAAKMLIIKAKARQIDALKANSSLE